MKILIILIGITLLEATSVGLYPVNTKIDPKIASLSGSDLATQCKIIFVNKISFGLHLPFFSKAILVWKHPLKEDVILIETKKGLRILKKVVSTTGEVIIKNQKRYIVPQDYVAVKNHEVYQNLNSPHIDTIDFINIKQVIGKVF